MKKEKISLILSVLLINLFLVTPVLATNATFEIYTISNSIISPNNSVGVLDDTSIDIKFSSEVTDVSVDILDSLGNLVKHIYDANNVTNPTPKTWAGKDSADSFVIDGVYTVQIVYADAGGVATDTAQTITVDNTSPIIALIGSNPVDLTVGDTYVDAGATSSDNIDGDITASIVTVNPVDTALIGAYTVTYDVSDLAGNSATQVSRVVNVNPIPVTPIAEPVIDPTPPSRSGGYVRGFEPNFGFVLGTSTERIEKISEEDLQQIEEKLRQIKRQLILIKHPELANISSFAVEETILETSSTSSTATSTPKKKWWQILW